MMSQTEAHRLAAAIHALRPDWPLASLSAFIAKSLTDRPYRDAAVALAWIATDPQTQTPARVLEAGPWWRAVMADGGTVSAVTTRCPEHPARAAWNCPECDTVTAPMPEGFKASLELKRRPRAAHPEPKPADLDALRDRIDAEAGAT
jgi:hypothetical protein